MKRKLLLALSVMLAGGVPQLLKAQGPPASQPILLSDSVNSSYDEMYPLLGPDNQYLYFIRGLHPENTGGEDAGQDIWVSERKPDGSWGQAHRIRGGLNNEADNGIGGISSDGKQIILSNIYHRGETVAAGLSYAKKKNGQWTHPKKLMEVEHLHPGQGQLSFYATPDLETLLIAMPAADTSHHEDLFVSFRQDDGSYSQPKNLGNTVNTEGYEFAPYLYKDGKTLYFSSDRHDSKGSTDIFKTTRLDDSWQRWSQPENVGAPINTEHFEAYLSFDHEGKTAYYVHGEDPSRMGDIYKIHMKHFIEPKEFFFLGLMDKCPDGPVSIEDFKKIGDVSQPELKGGYQYQVVLKARTADSLMKKVRKYMELHCPGALPTKARADTSQGLEPELKKAKKPEEEEAKPFTFTGFIENCPPDMEEFLNQYREIGKVTETETGQGFDYEIFIEAKTPQALDKKILAYFEIICPEKKEEAEGKVNEEQVVVKQYLTKKGLVEEEPKPKKEVVVLQNILFGFDKAFLRTSERDKLNAAARQLKQNPDYQMILRGHTDAKGSTEYNVELGRRRAKAVKDFLVKQGIASERVHIKSFGEGQPIATNENPEGRQKNRRVEFKLVK